ncbi:SIMPL domain-containing protein [Pelagibacterium xiamenense]|uniref:SIMPL domain-containing protein n=1 Tax=Pelagibacterium xiamenense TaxID=2901140 RepID=UPI001E30A1AD|nr:SIMPL domain-containing protein [Pelagibacterium xiamenense]MCD7060212.1 SIMPL domain-containing protein [Pelagibacterium xiamenense]
MRISSLLAATGLALAPALPALADDPQMVLSGTGTVLATPDMATITTGVTTQAETARAALDANTAAMDELIGVLQSAGLAPRDIQTSDFSVSPQYVYSDRRDESGFTPPPEIAGYQVSNAVTITVRDLDSLGAVLDQAVTVGANTINGISFSVADTAEIMAQARRRAVEDAIKKADIYADAAGITLGDIVSITEQPQGGAPQPMMARAEMAFDSAVPVQAGEMSYEVTATLTWEIEDAQ